jgi:hypothetical protein
VTDSGNHRVQIFSSAGVYLSQFGTNGAGNGQFASPKALRLTRSVATLSWTDSGNQRVQIFSSTGVYLSQFGSPGAGDGQFSNPQGGRDRPVQS